MLKFVNKYCWQYKILGDVSFVNRIMGLLPITKYNLVVTCIHFLRVARLCLHLSVILQMMQNKFTL